MGPVAETRAGGGVPTSFNEEKAMSDNKSNRGSPDRDRIDMSDEDEVRNWTKSLGVSKEELQRAVQAAGDRAEQVRAWLGNRSR
jgi:hypothetical protein